MWPESQIQQQEKGRRTKKASQRNVYDSNDDVLVVREDACFCSTVQFIFAFTLDQEIGRCAAASKTHGLDPNSISHAAAGLGGICAA